ncbi:MAG: hypothetical protein HQM08_07775 [Candidatus Riflebacteria bacterium]|nr:hypothetical protein [Candidatus Riflebacteria bacterium]
MQRKGKNTSKTQSIDYSAIDKMIEEAIMDEERILANLAFDPIIIGRQLRELRFSSSDFQGLESNKILIEAMLTLLLEEQMLNAQNLIKRLSSEKKSGRLKIDIVGGRERIQKLFLSPFSTAGIIMIEDIESVVDRIRDRNVRNQARRILIQYSENVYNSDREVFESMSGCIQDLRTLFLQGTTGYIKNMDIHIEEMKELIQSNRSRQRGYGGFETNFPLLMERISGIQKELYLVAGGVGMGKSTFLTQLAWDLANCNPELTVLFFSLDLNRIDVTAKLIAQAMEVPIDFVKNPYLSDPQLEEKRIRGLEKVSSLNDRLFIIDESNGRIFLDDIKKLVKRTKLERGGDVAVLIDPVFKIHLRDEITNFAEKCNLLSAELKSISAVEGVTLIASAGLPKAVSNRRPIREDLAEITGLLYDPYVVFFLYSDYLNDFETPFLEWELGKDSFMIPISEAYVAKNKMGGINTRVFFRYYESYSKYKECAPQEVENYNAMIENLQRFKDDKRMKDKGYNESKAHSMEEEL